MDHTIKISASKKVGAIRGKLRIDEEIPLKFFKQFNEIGFEVGVATP